MSLVLSPCTSCAGRRELFQVLLQMAFLTAVTLTGSSKRASLVTQRRPSGSQPVVACAGASLDAALSRLRSHSQSTTDVSGTVYLVGTGPGDPGLLTLRAVQLMSTADVVLYDRLVSDEILSYVNPNAIMLYVGKEKGLHTRTQEEIHTLLRSFAAGHRTVLRLKGGDPFVFGRGGEETKYLQNAGVSVRVVPGITAAAGIGAELGIPLTHRGVARSVKFVTGHVCDGDTPLGPVDNETTLVLYMALGLLPKLVHEMRAQGLYSDTPAVAVERGTTPEQRIVWDTLERLPASVEERSLKSPTLVIVGQVVKLAEGWRNAMERNLLQSAVAKQ